MRKRSYKFQTEAVLRGEEDQVLQVSVSGSQGTVYPADKMIKQVGVYLEANRLQADSGFR